MNSPPCKIRSAGVCGFQEVVEVVVVIMDVGRTRLTARTLNSDVFPAFCSPIIVMSISVALQHIDGQHASLLVGTRLFSFLCWRMVTQVGGQIAHQASKAHRMVRDGSGRTTEVSRRTRTGAAASHRCVGTGSPWFAGGHGANDSGGELLARAAWVVMVVSSGVEA